MGVARDVLHADAAAAVPEHFVARHQIQQLLQRDPAFHSRERGAQAAVNAVAEPQVLRLGAIAADVEGVRRGPGIGVAVGRGAQQEHRGAGRDGHAMQPDLAGGPAHVVLHRRVIAQQFLDRRGDQGAVVEQLLPLLGVTGEGGDRAPHELGHRFGAGTAE